MFSFASPPPVFHTPLPPFFLLLAPSDHKFMLTDSLRSSQDLKLRAAMQDYENERWRIIANKVGPGFTPVACRERASQLSGGQSMSPPVVSAPAPESSDTLYPQQLH